MTRLTDFSGEQLEEGMLKAMRAGDMDAVVGILRAMAVVDPDRAQGLKAAVDFGLSLRGRGEERETQ